MRAYTLFEILIVLVLLAVIMLLISIALDIHLRQMAINRTEIEEAQLARAVLEKIAQEIRSVVVASREETADTDSTGIAAALGLDTASLSETETAETGSAAESETGTAEEPPVIYGEMPGIYGEIDWIQIDTARLPRGEMYGSRQIRRGTSAAADRLSPSKTVLYYLGKDTGQLTSDDPRYQPDALIGATGRSAASDAAQYGLFRRQLDRQVMQYSIQTQTESEDELHDEPLAPEVEWIEFAYFDTSAAATGTTGEWTDTWDMDDRQALPAAVRITLAIRRQNFGKGLLSAWTQETETVPNVVYSLVVPVPVSQPAESTESTASESVSDE
ncbi:MAG: GspJ family type II secretion system protein [Planctomycetaceae bacterium]|jgi:hypothetical protein|nr:GspJ family type II secretion system protein [Planctomycetaceae bacterium]